MLVQRLDDLIPACLRRGQGDVFEEICRWHRNLAALARDAEVVSLNFFRLLERVDLQLDHVVEHCKAVARQVDLEAQLLTPSLTVSCRVTADRPGGGANLGSSAIHHTGIEVIALTLGHEDPHAGRIQAGYITHHRIGSGRPRGDHHILEQGCRRHLDFFCRPRNLDGIALPIGGVFGRLQLESELPLERLENVAGHCHAEADMTVCRRESLRRRILRMCDIVAVG